MKVAVSLPDELFADADLVAQKLKISRSQLYAKAIARFLEEQGPDPVTDKLNELAEVIHSAPHGTEAGRLLIDQGSWEW